MKKKEQKNKEQENEKEKGNKKKVFKILSIGVVVAVVLSCAGAAIYFYSQYKRVVKNAAYSVQDENKRIVDSIGKFMDLPGEEPKIATITDSDKLKDQVFFANAQNGDKVLIYSSSKKAILYRPQTGRVIEVTSLLANSQNNSSETKENNSSTQTENQSQNEELNQTNSQNEIQGSGNEDQNQAETAAKEVKAAIYNGAKAKGLASDIADKILAIPGIQVTEKTNAKGMYDKNLIIDLSGGNEEKIQEIITLIGGEAGDLPEGERKPEADILVIGGK
jgi:hypothetical protein